MRIPGGISSLNDNPMAENSRRGPQVGLNQCFLKIAKLSLMLFDAAIVTAGKYRRGIRMVRFQPAGFVLLCRRIVI